MSTQDDLFRKSQKTEFWEKLNAGDVQCCPTCNRTAMACKTTLNSTLTWMLIRLYRVSMERTGKPGGFIHVNDFSPGRHSTGRNFCIVHHWGLATSAEAEPDEDKNSSGYWRLTAKGIAFIMGELDIPKYIFVFGNKVINTGKDTWDVHAALKNKFSYSELMNVTELKGAPNA